MEATESSTPRRRSERVNPEQLEFLLNYMQSHPRLREGKLSLSYTKIQRKREWEQLAASLNSLGGANKDATMWRKTWNDQKGYARNKAAKLRRINEQTGRGRDGSVDALNPIEESLLGMTGWKAATGDLSVPEAGIPTSDSVQYNAQLLHPLYDCEEMTISEREDSFPLPASSTSSIAGSSRMGESAVPGSSRMEESAVPGSSRMEDSAVPGSSRMEDSAPGSSTAADDNVRGLSANVTGPSIPPNQGAKRSTLTKKAELAPKELRSHSLSIEKNTAAVERMAADISEMTKLIKNIAESIENLTNLLNMVI